MKNPFKQANCICTWDSSSHLMKDKPDRALCKDPHVGMSDPVMGEAVRSSCYLSAELFSKSEPFAVQQPLQVMPEYLQRAPCKNTLRVDGTRPMNYTLFIIIEPSLFPSCFQSYGLEQFLILYLFQGRKMFFFKGPQHSCNTNCWQFPQHLRKYCCKAFMFCTSISQSQQCPSRRALNRPFSAFCYN